MTSREDISAALASEQDKADNEEKGKKWEPKEGDELIGVLEEGRWQGSKYGLSRLLLIREDGTDELYAVWCSSKVLGDLVGKAAPKNGSVIGIKYTGTKHSEESGYDYKTYALHVTESDQQQWYDSLLAAKQADEEYQSRKAANGGKKDRPKVDYGPDEAPF